MIFHDGHVVQVEVLVPLVVVVVVVSGIEVVTPPDQDVDESHQSSKWS